jgi:hypothetical protein
MCRLYLGSVQSRRSATDAVFATQFQSTIAPITLLRRMQGGS